MADHILHDSIPAQCIVCLERMGRVVVSPEHDAHLPATDTDPCIDNDEEDEREVAIIQECKHILHAFCLKSWVLTANSCPICRGTIHLVDVFNKIGGDLLETLPIEDKKQVAEFDPTAWIEDEAEDYFDSQPCPICNTADREDILLLCDACDAPYHTVCVGLDEVPQGHWFCMECQSEGASDRAADPTRVRRTGRQPRTFAQRTQAQVRRGRNGGRWLSAWDAVAERVWDTLNLDLDAPDFHDDHHLSAYRSHERRTEREQQEFHREQQRWQRRLAIASRQGARDIFRQAARPMFSGRERPEPKTPEPTPEEKKAWDAFEKVRDTEVNGSASRKRKSRSITTSPREKAAQEPERKLKRPKTRRLVDKPRSSSNDQASSRQDSVSLSSSTPNVAAPTAEANAPSFLSSLLKEVEMSASTDDESTSHTHYATATSPSIGHSSPVVSPSTSNYSTPRALSTTPPPNGVRRPASPLPLTSRLEPNFPPANYSPNRSPPGNYHNPDGGDRSRPMTPELRQPRPQRRQPVLPRSEETSPTRFNMSIEAKEGINKIVRVALDPHYNKPSGITKEQYADINRAVSRMLYERIADPEKLEDETAKSAWKRIATREVAKAIEGLSA